MHKKTKKYLISMLATISIVIGTTTIISSCTKKHLQTFKNKSNTI